MTIGILTFGELSYHPFLGKYTEILDADGVVYDVVYWNRELLQEEPWFRCRRLHRYGKPSPMRRWKPGKLWDFLGYRKFLVEVLENNRYDRLIVLTTLPAVLLAGTLERRYSGRYVFDVRDYAYEHVPPFYARVKRVVDRAALCVYSSPGFGAWLPPADWKISHNVSDAALADWLGRESSPPESVFRRPVRVLRLIGRTRNREDQMAVIDQLGGDPGYEVHYHGDDVNAWDAEAYARSRGASNIHFHGRFKHTERWEFYADSDLVMSSYDRRLPGQSTPLNNRLYDGAMALRPHLASRGTYLGEVVEENGLGFAIDVRREPIRAAVEGYAARFDAARFAADCRSFLARVQREDEAFVAAVRAFARGA